MSSKRHRPAKPRARASVEESRAAEATELQELAARHPDERQGLLSDAADLWSEAGEYDRAVAVYQELLDTGCDDPHLIEAFRIGALWDGGRRNDARAAAALLRRQHPKDPGAWNTVAEMFEVSDEPRTATEWYTAGVEMLLVGRHRARRLLGEPHDDAADLAARGRAQAWPPPRNSPCWCGSTRKYKKCCGNPALV